MNTIHNKRLICPPTQMLAPPQEKVIEAILFSVAMEFNGPTTRKYVEDMITRALKHFCEADVSVVCDESNNTGLEIRNGKLVVDISIGGIDIAYKLEAEK